MNETPKLDELLNYEWGYREYAPYKDLSHLEWVQSNACRHALESLLSDMKRLQDSANIIGNTSLYNFAESALISAESAAMGQVK